ncbi:hypothetical protein V8G61_04125 [Gaetbulibacter sp. M240]|uniref:OB-fold protein n=1 Tax=Gaetbulibacter sp. M240 TaxID=3126511 RepID=UPI00374F188E
MKTIKNKLLILIVIILLCFVGYKYVYQDHRNIETEKAAFILSTKELFTDFSVDEGKAERKYLNQTILVTGKVISSDEISISLDGNVFCQFSDSLELQPEPGKTIKIKGRFIGYDDLLEEIKLDQSNIID